MVIFPLPRRIRTRATAVLRRPVPMATPNLSIRPRIVGAACGLGASSAGAPLPNVNWGVVAAECEVVSGEVSVAVGALVSMNRQSRLGQEVFGKVLRLLSLMWMLGAGVDLELLQHVNPELVLGQHSPHSFGDNPLWEFFQHLRAGREAATARIAGVALVDLFGELDSEFWVLGMGQRLAAET